MRADGAIHCAIPRLTQAANDALQHVRAAFVAASRSATTVRVGAIVLSDSWCRYRWPLPLAQLVLPGLRSCGSPCYGAGCMATAAFAGAVDLISPCRLSLALQLRFMGLSESMGDHDSKIVGAGSVD